MHTAILRLVFGQLSGARLWLPLILWSDFHVFEPPDLWQTRIDRAFRDRAPRIERIDGGDYVVVVEKEQILSSIGLISSTRSPARRCHDEVEFSIKCLLSMQAASSTVLAG